MKKLLSLLLVISVLLISCNKDDDESNKSGKLYPVKFTTKLNFGSEDTPLLKSGSDTTNNPTDTVYYHYLVYSSNGTPVKQLKGQGTEINDQLPGGSYYISLVASNDSYLNYGGYNFQKSNYLNDVVNFPKAYYNTFAYSVDTSSIASNATKSVDLEKMWGEVELNILDKATCHIPANVIGISVKVEGYSNSFLMKYKKGVYSDTCTVYTHNTVSGFRNQESINCLVSYPTDNKTADIYLVVDYYNKPSKTISIAAVNVKKGMKTVLKGNLGNILKEEINENKINLVLDEKWNNEIINF